MVADSVVRMRVIVLVVIGAALAAAQHLTLGWWLNAGTRVAITLVVVCVTTAIATRTLAEAVALWGGLILAWGVVLFVIGPGNIWPIVLAFICGLTAMSVAAGRGLRWGIEQGLAVTKIRKGSP